MSSDNNKIEERTNFAKPKGRSPGIEAVHVSAAREMVQLHTRGRLPIQLQQTKSNRIPRSSTKPQEVCKLKDEWEASISIPARGHGNACRNPCCDNCGQVVIPAPQSSFPIEDKPSISINDWSVYSIKKPILNSEELDLRESIFQFPCPEMIFGNSSLSVVNHKDNFSIEFNAIDALSSIEEDSNLKVSYHEEWLESRRAFPGTSIKGSAKQSASSLKDGNTKDLSRILELETVRPYDWTYTPNYKGTTKNIRFEPTEESIPIEKLLRPDPMLFFDEAVLFEDELGDNGISILSAKIRVMPSCLLLLCRFFLRIDNVIFRVRDTRIYVDFVTNLFLREYKEQECSYDNLMKKINNEHMKDPKSLLRDSNWVAQNIPVLNRSIEIGHSANVSKSNE